MDGSPNSAAAAYLGQPRTFIYAKDTSPGIFQSGGSVPAQRTTIRKVTCAPSRTVIDEGIMPWMAVSESNGSSLQLIIVAQRYHVPVQLRASGTLNRLSSTDGAALCWHLIESKRNERRGQARAATLAV